MNYLLKSDPYEWLLSEEKCQGIFNDEILPINELTFTTVMSWMKNLDSADFELEYYEDDCEVCPTKARGKKRLVPYLEGHFYVFTKLGNVVTTSIEPSFEMGSYDALILKGEVDQSYIMSVIVCPDCGSFQLSLEQVDM